jgi:topoisomerase-4 subunit A
MSRRRKNSEQGAFDFDESGEKKATESKGKKKVLAKKKESVEVVVEEVRTQSDEGGAPLAEHYRNWFLQYASYVILDRAIPYLDDGLKPVQRRILQTMYEMDDGRFHKVANIVGQCMALHPHGDASIAAALVAVGQKGLLIEAQGNFGNSMTGDAAAASRYIEARLSPFAREVLFNPKTTVWQVSYDGRKKEPVTLPVKFPLLLADGVEGIGVGLSTKVLPHNFNELLDASISYLRKNPFTLYPDFQSGGTADFSAYNDGQRGGKVRVRAKIEQLSKYVLVIRELPFGVTTTSLIDSIVAASNKGKIKVKHIDDNTAGEVEILVHLPSGTDTSKAIDQLFVFTDCQVTLSPAACIIENELPVFVGVTDILKRSTDRTVDLLRQELEIRLGELEDRWHADSLERIFIEEKIYRRIEKSETWESVLAEIRKGLEPFLHLLRRKISDDDIVRLTEIRIKRISRYNRFKADEAIRRIEEEMEEVKKHLKQLTRYAVAWFKKLKEKFGSGRERRTISEEIEAVSAVDVVMVNEKLYVNREEGFIGLGLKKDEFVEDCSAIDEVICFMGDGTMKVSKVADKVFMGKEILHVAVFKKEDPAVYSMAYKDGGTGRTFAKRFKVSGVTRDKAYELTKGKEGSKVYYFSKGTEDEAPKVAVKLSGRSKARIKKFEFEFASIAVKGRGSAGNILTKWPVLRIE